MSDESNRHHGDANESSSTPDGDSALRRNLGLLQVSLAGIGLILEAGSHALIRQAAAASGSLVWITFAALFEEGGAGYGTLGLPEPEMRKLVEGAGFSRFRRVDLTHPVNAFYEARI